MSTGMHVSECCTVEAAAVYVSEEDKHVNIDHLQVEPIADGQMMTTYDGVIFYFHFQSGPLWIVVCVNRDCTSAHKEL